MTKKCELKEIFETFFHTLQAIKHLQLNILTNIKPKKLVIILKAVLWMKLINNRAKNNTGEVLVRTSMVPSQKINGKNPINYGFFSARIEL